MNRIDILVRGIQWFSYANRVLNKLSKTLKISMAIDEVGGQYA